MGQPISDPNLAAWTSDQQPNQSLKLNLIEDSKKLIMTIVL